MSWTKIDDRLLTHVKMRRARGRMGDAALALWTAALVYTNQHEFDGLVYADMLGDFTSHADPLTVASVLVDVGLWERDGENFRFHDYAAMNDTKAVRDSKRAEDRERKAALAEERKAKGKGAKGKKKDAPADAPKLSDRNPDGKSWNADGKNTFPGPQPNPTQPIPSLPNPSSSRDSGCRLESTSGPPVRATSNPDAAKILERLRSHRELAHVATVGHAERFAGLLMAGKKLDWLLSAIDDLARAAGSAALANTDWSAEVMGNKLQTFGSRAAAPRQEATPAAGQGRATPHPSGGAYEPRSGFSSVPSEEEIWGPTGKPKEARP